MNEYNMIYHEISVAIYQWAESQIMRPHLDRQYFDDQLHKAFDLLSKQEFNYWIPICETYKGKSLKKRGSQYICVRMANGQDYGFTSFPPRSEQIYKLLHNLWMDYIGNPNKDTP